ncbi:MAG TPA: hypothetical protein VFJ43_12465 [Bacteroidia bacterium]|nr:hypothetical protein [Bacteroidia bacterium]
MNTTGKKEIKEVALSFNSLRQTIGWLGLFLPLGLYVGNALFSDCSCLQDSISHYYYTRMGVLLVAVLVILGVVLIYYPAYKKETKLDGVLTTISGIAALCVAFFPTFANSNDSCALFDLPHIEARNIFHFTSAATMLLIFSWLSCFVFTLSKVDKKSEEWKAPGNKWKRYRNVLYIVCGIITFLSVVSIGVITFLEARNLIIISSKYTFWFEVAALVPFGIGWLIKGGFALTDDDEKSTARHFAEKLRIVKESPVNAGNNKN